MAEPDPQPTAAWAAGGTVWPESGPARGTAGDMVTGLIHHLEFWVPDLDRSVVSWGWLLDELGYQPFGDWPGGRSWRAGHTYIVLEQSPDRTASRHDRKRPGTAVPDRPGRSSPSPPSARCPVAGPADTGQCARRGS